MNYLQDLARTIGWTLVNDDEGFSVYEFKEALNKYETVSHIVKIYDQPTEVELFDILQTLKKVLPRKLNKKINKILKDVKIEDLANVVDVVSFAVEEYVAKTDFSKLKEYGELVGVNIESMGYKFKYKLPKREMAEIIAKIENNVPIEQAPILGRIKKLDYKIAYIKNQKIRTIQDEN